MTKSAFISRRKNSQFLQLEIVFPKGFEFPSCEFEAMFRNRRHYTKSLKTTDPAEAEILAADYIHAYRLAVYLWRKGKDLVKLSDGYKYADGLAEIDGRQAYVKGRDITLLDQDGRPAGHMINPTVGHRDATRVTDPLAAAAFVHFDAKYKHAEPAKVAPQFTPKGKTPDDELIEDYIDFKPRNPKIIADVRQTWDAYKANIGKPLKKATRQDGRAFAQALADQDLSNGSITKKVGWLRAAVQHAIKESKFHGVNPFSDVVGEVGHAEEKREPLSEEQMALCWDNLHLLSNEDQLLWKLLAKTGMRLGEAHGVKAEKAERGTGIRYVEIGTKTEASQRAVPVPLDIGMPDHIDGRLFSGRSPAAGARLRLFIRSVVPNSEGLVVHSLRHRAVDVFRLANAGDSHLRRRLLGHASKDEHDEYGSKHPPMTLLLGMLDANPIDGSFRLASDAAPIRHGTVADVRACLAGAVDS